MTGLPEIQLSTSAYTVGHWTLDLDEELRGAEATNRFDLNAPYQRASVWTLDQRQALIKSLYMGLPVGSVIVSKLPYRPDGASWRIVDGKQRVETVRMFVTDGFKVPSEWFSVENLARPCPDMVTFADLTPRGQRMLTMSRQLPALEFDPQRIWLGRDSDGESQWAYRNDEQILLAEAELYLLVNGAGTPHGEDDLRRAAGLLASR